MSRPSPGGLQDLARPCIAGVVLLFLTGLIHLLVTPEYHGFAAYLGLLMLADFGGSVVSVEALFVGLAAYVLAWRRATASSGEGT